VPPATPAVRSGLLRLNFREPFCDPAPVTIALGDVGSIDGSIALPKLCYLRGECLGAFCIHDARASDPIWIPPLSVTAMATPRGG
jgi:hypothetical protein